MKDTKNILLLAHNSTLTWKNDNTEDVFSLSHNQRSLKNVLILLLIIYFVNTSILRKPFNTKLTAYVRYFVNQVDSK